MPWRCARSRISVIALAIAAGTSKVARSSSMRPASTFDRSRMSLISCSRCLPDAVDVLQVVVLLLVELAEQALEQHLGEADDRVERRAQLVRHVREELGLVLVGGLELPALVLDFAEEPRVLDGDDRLVGESLQQGDVLVGERSRDSRGRRGSTPMPLPSHSIGAPIAALMPISCQPLRANAGRPSSPSTSG